MPRNKKANLIVWHLDSSETWQTRAVTDAIELRAAGLAREANEPRVSTDAVVHPLCPVSGFLAALLFAEPWARRVSLNGIPLPPGIHLLRHADRVDVDQQTFWISTQATIEEATYDPAVHGEEVFCFMTKARLTAGQAIKICPGVPGNDCGVIYKAAAWDMAMQSSTPLKCPSCGYRPGQAEWHPPVPKIRKSINGILQLINN